MKHILKILSTKNDPIKTKFLCMDELYYFIPKTSLTLFILSIIFLYLFWEQVAHHTVLVGWFIATQILILIHLYDYVHYFDQSYHHPQDHWYQRFHHKALFNALLWGVLPILFFHQVNSSSQMFMIFFIVGFAGSVAVMLSDFRIAFPFISLLLIPLILIVGFSEKLLYPFVLQFLLSIFYILLVISNKHLYQLVRSIQYSQKYLTKLEREMRTKEKKLNSLLYQAPVGIFYYDTDLKVVRYNDMFKTILGHNNELIGFDLHQLKDQQAVQILQEVLNNYSHKETFGSYNFSYHDKVIWVELTCSAMHGENGKVTGGIGILEDKTIEHRAYEKINFISLHDTLTKLPNRRYYIDFMHDLIHASKNQLYYSILLYMDLNRFKQINDTFGHNVGDKLLLEVANRFKSLEIENAHLARLGGDEFVLAIPFISTDPQIAKNEATLIANKIKKLFHSVFEIEGLNLYMTTSIGIVIVEPKTDDIDNIIRQADMAMYQTKREGQDNISFYNKQLDLEQQDLTALQQDLSHAISQNELTLYYQPIVNIRDDTLTAIEALVRWNHPKKGLILPDRFIPMATESGLINKVGWWVANDVCRQLSEWKRKELIHFEYVSININARQLHEIDFSQHIEECIQKYQIDPSLIKLEVTETTLIDSFTKTQKIVKDLRERGVECSIDDFGTGYSSLSYLKKLSFKLLKIDRIFITDILTNKDDQELVKSIIGIGKQFHYKIIIEGIETEEQKKKILEINKDVAYQGFLRSRPIPALEFEDKFL